MVQQTPGYTYGLQQYCLALRDLALNLSSPCSKGLESALLCCQIFISIEQARENFTAMGQHITQGLRIMQEYRIRPSFVAANRLVSADHNRLPFLDIFLIKLFAAPCKFADPPVGADTEETNLSLCSRLPHQQSIESRNLRTIAPNMRTELRRIAASTLEFLDKVAHVKSAGSALQLLSEKVSLLKSLESWLVDLELVDTQIKMLETELVSVTFLRFFHQMLKIILLGALDSSPDLLVRLRTENDQLQGIAHEVGERVRAYRARRRVKHS
jgi:hypothetical protein